MMMIDTSVSKRSFSHRESSIQALDLNLKFEDNAFEFIESSNITRTESDTLKITSIKERDIIIGWQVTFK